MYGKGISKDKTQIFYWAEKAAIQGDVDAKSYLNNLCFLGIGTKKDTEKATYWLQKPNRNGSKEG